MSEHAKWLGRAARRGLPVAAFALYLGICPSAARAESSHPISVHVEPELSIQAEDASLTLTFSDFREGSRSGTAVAAYRLRANNFRPGTLREAVSVQTRGEAFEGIELEAAFQSYQNLGPADFCRLEAAQDDFEAVGTDPLALADKKPGSGRGDLCADGRLVIAWRATLTRDLPAGTQTRSVLVTLKDAD